MTEKTKILIEEKAYNAKNGWSALILSVLVYILSIVGIVIGGIMMDSGLFLGVLIFVPSIIYACIGWIFWLGLKVIRPNEAIVLTLFGKYIGTLKSEGFFYVNPFCTAINPAAKTKLNQSGDVKSGASPVSISSNGSVAVNAGGEIV